MRRQGERGGSRRRIALPLYIGDSTAREPVWIPDKRAVSAGVPRLRGFFTERTAPRKHGTPAGKLRFPADIARLAVGADGGDKDALVQPRADKLELLGMGLETHSRLSGSEGGEGEQTADEKSREFLYRI